MCPEQSPRRPWQDAIGDRLDHPERVPAEYQHLIPDDEQRVHRILAYPVHPEARLLDVGCSDGSITCRIARRWDVTTTIIGADLDRSMFGCYEGFATFLAWDCRHPWPHLPTRFDRVYACELFEHLTDRETLDALDHIGHVLAPEGDLIVTVPNRDCADHYVAGCRDRWKWPDHRSAWTKRKLSLFLDRRFQSIRYQALYECEEPSQSIWLIARAHRLKGGLWRQESANA